MSMLLSSWLPVLLIFVNSIPSYEKFYFHETLYISQSFYIHFFFNNAILTTNHHP